MQKFWLKFDDETIKIEFGVDGIIPRGHVGYCAPRAGALHKHAPGKKKKRSVTSNIWISLLLE
jgi:hypothetical protein